MIAVSSTDVAGRNIGRRLINEHSFTETDRTHYGWPEYRRDNVTLIFLDAETVYAENLGFAFSAEAVVFGSRHESRSGKPTLTVHATGNLTNRSEYGGKPRSLAWAHPQRMKAALITLLRLRDEMQLDYSVSLEATHHGPTEGNTPVLFVEIGSSQIEWEDPLATSVAADAAWAAATQPASGISTVGFGGGHYSAKLTQVSCGNEWAVGHILPKHVLREFDQQIVRLAFMKTHGECRTAIIDSDGFPKPHRDKLLLLLERAHIKVVTL